MRQNRRFVCFILVRNPVTFVAGFFFFPTTRNNFSGVVVMTKSKAKKAEVREMQARNSREVPLQKETVQSESMKDNRDIPRV
jgi:hypothetical protein